MIGAHSTPNDVFRQAETGWISKYFVGAAIAPKQIDQEHKKSAAKNLVFTNQG